MRWPLVVEFDPSELPDVDALIVSEAEKRGLTREQAIEDGRRLAQLECDRLQVRRPDLYIHKVCAERTQRAAQYAAWEYDGRQAGTIGRKERGES